MFKEGDVVVCLYNDKREDGDASFILSLTVGKLYTVVSSYYSKSGNLFINISDNRGIESSYYARRFSLAEEASPHQAVINKIKSMDNKRKSLGYRW